MHFSTLNVNEYNFIFINSGGMLFYIIYHNLDNDNVCARSVWKGWVGRKG
jgi:hypothetical protein